MPRSLELDQVAHVAELLTPCGRLAFLLQYRDGGSLAVSDPDVVWFVGLWLELVARRR